MSNENPTGIGTDILNADVRTYRQHFYRPQTVYPFSDKLDTPEYKRSEIFIDLLSSMRRLTQYCFDDVHHADTSHTGGGIYDAYHKTLRLPTDTPGTSQYYIELWLDSYIAGPDDRTGILEGYALNSEVIGTGQESGPGMYPLMSKYTLERHIGGLAVFQREQYIDGIANALQYDDESFRYGIRPEHGTAYEARQLTLELGYLASVWPAEVTMPDEKEIP